MRVRWRSGGSISPLVNSLSPSLLDAKKEREEKHINPQILISPPPSFLSLLPSLFPYCIPARSWAPGTGLRAGRPCRPRGQCCPRPPLRGIGSPDPCPSPVCDEGRRRRGVNGLGSGTRPACRGGAAKQEGGKEGGRGRKARRRTWR